jgi:energy-coupling factor transporter ATP-binding protein EcfA2
MRLSSIRVTEFRSVRDSQSFEVGEVTCLVGKNESGKTALLQALYRLNPIVTEHARFTATEDYPRAYVKRYERAVKAEEIDPQVVVEATFELGEDELKEVEGLFGRKVLPKGELVLSRGYSNELVWKLEVDEGLGVSHVAKAIELETAIRDSILQEPTFAKLATGLAENANVLQNRRNEAIAIANALTDQKEKADALAAATLIQESEGTKGWRTWIEKHKSRPLPDVIYDLYLKPKIPVFLYFDEYYQMEGHVNVPALKTRQQNKQLLDSDRPMLGLIDLAGLEVDQLVSPPNTQDLINNLEGASNDLTRQIMPYWSQNKHIALRFDIRPGAPGDPEGMRQGMNLWANVYDSAHSVTLRVGTRSRGFLWFFSFLAWFSQHKKSKQPIILLLDEPGLFLHAAAQGDLLQYIETELMGHHQVIYTTHSPFMVDATHFDRVRLVRDRSLDADKPLPETEEGTKVYSDPLEVDDGTLFPIQGALGYDLAQTLFVGPNSLIVEGVSDLLYIQAISAVLEVARREGLSRAWTITPVGGSDKVPTFVALLGSQKGLKIATLIDLQKKDAQQIENLYKKKLLNKKHVHTFAEFIGGAEADIEDMFDPGFYIELVNSEYAANVAKPVGVGDLPVTNQRMLEKLAEYFEAHPMRGGGFNHYRPARYLAEHMQDLKDKISPKTLDRFEAAFKVLNGLL